MTPYIRFEDMYFIVNLAFIYVGLGECFQTRPRSKLFCKLQFIIFSYMTLLSTYAGVSGIYMFFVLITSTGDVIYTIEDAVQILPSCLLDLLMVCINVTIFIKKDLNNEIIQDIMRIYPNPNLADEEVLTILAKTMKPVKLMIQVFSCITNLQPFGFCLPAAIMALVFNKGYRLPFMMWYPYDFSASITKYLLTLYMQFVATSYTAFSMAGVDCALVVAMVNISMQLNLLAKRLTHIAPHNRVLSADELKVIDRKLHGIVKDHIHIIKLVKKMQRMYSLILFMKYALSAGLICQCLISIMISKPSKQWNFIMFLSSMLIELFIICWYGQDIIHKSQALSQAAFESGWPEFDRRCKRKIQIIQARSQKPLQLNAMGFACISIAVFTAMVKAGWSFFSIARKVFEKYPKE